jgi:hypothetical protein
MVSLSYTGRYSDKKTRHEDLAQWFSTCPCMCKSPVCKLITQSLNKRNKLLTKIENKTKVWEKIVLVPFSICLFHEIHCYVAQASLKFSIAQVGFEVKIFPPQLPMFWKKRCAPTCPVMISLNKNQFLTFLYIYIYINTYTCISYTQTYMYIYINIYVYVYIYIYRKREREIKANTCMQKETIQMKEKRKENIFSTSMP